MAEVTSKTHRLIISLALGTGMRRDEVLKLRWAEVALEERVIRLGAHRTKGKRTRIIPISEELFEELSAHMRAERKHGEWVVPNPRTKRPFYDVSPWFQEAASKAGIEDLHFHDLRHTFATRWLRRGGSEPVLREILGHRSTQTTKRYMHVVYDHIQEEARRVFRK